MFVVTRAGQSVKLGLVTVTVHELAATETATRAWLAEVAVRESLFLRTIADVESIAKDASADIAIATAGIADANQAFPPSPPLKNPSSGDEPIYMRTLAQMGLDDSSVAAYRRVRAASHVRMLRSAEAKLAGARRTLEQIEPVRRIEALVRKLPQPLSSCQSDADGGFVLRIPARHPVAIFARAKRVLPGGIENYLWLIRLPGETRSGMKLLLSNETMASGTSPLSLLRLPD